jgi:hypothetical protein
MLLLRVAGSMLEVEDVTTKVTFTCVFRDLYAGCVIETLHVAASVRPSACTFHVINYHISICSVNC